MRKPLEKELKSYREQGISLYLNGILSNPKTIAKACQIAEGGGYMRDYVEDDGCEVVYLPRTPEISTTQIKKDLNNKK